MRASDIILRLLTEARLLKDYRTQKVRYYAAPVDYSDQGYVVFADAPSDDVSHLNIIRQFNKDYPENNIWRSQGMIVDHASKTVNVDLEEFQQYRHRRPSPTNSRDSYTIAAPQSAFPESPLRMKKLLTLVVQQDPAVSEFKIVGSDTYNMTVGEFLRVPDQAQTVVQKTSGEITVYHGTSMIRARQILAKGLRPGNSKGVSDLVPGYSDHNIYLTPNRETARNYASRAAQVDHSPAVVLQVKVRDFTKIVPDEDMMHWLRLSKLGKQYYDQIIKDVPDLKNPETGQPYSDTHFRHHNWSKVSPAMGKLLRAWAADAKVYRGSFAYRGIIHPHDIKVVQTYKPVKMRRDPNDQEWKDAMEKTHASLVNYGDQNPFKAGKAEQYLRGPEEH